MLWEDYVEKSIKNVHITNIITSDLEELNYWRQSD